MDPKRLSQLPVDSHGQRMREMARHKAKQEKVIPKAHYSTNFPLLIRIRHHETSRHSHRIYFFSVVDQLHFGLLMVRLFELGTSTSPSGYTGYRYRPHDEAGIS